VKALTSNTFDQAPGGIIFREARVLLSLHLFLVSVAHVPRGYNMCAHELAKSALQRDLDQPVIWTDPLPSFVSALLDRERVDPNLSEYFSGNSIWKAEAEGKHKFFAWLLVQCKLLTADKLMARQWPCNPMCSLCNQEQETAGHLILHCSFAKLVWQKIGTWTQPLVRAPDDSLEIIDWWEKELAYLPAKKRRLKAALLMYCAWNIWKERNRRVFDQVQKTPAEVMQEIKAEVNTRKLACGGLELP